MNWRKVLSWEEPELNKKQKAKANILYAIYSAEAVLPIYENKYPNDNRPRLAIEAAKIALKYPTEENKAKARAAASAATASAASAAWAAAAATVAAAAYAIKYAIKYAKKAAKEANIDIDFDSLLYKAQSDIWEYINISEANNTSEASLKVAWEEKGPIHYRVYTPLGENVGFGLCNDVFEKYENVPLNKLKKLIVVTDDWKYVTCPACKKAMRVDQLMKKLFEEHEKEAERHRAEFYNFGAGMGEYSIYSRTSKGGLESNINSRTGRVTHVWMD
jgi:hypothetical protein